MLDKGQEDDWFSSHTIVMLCGHRGRSRLVALVIRELTADDPVVDLRVFKERSYAVGVFLMTVLGFVLYGSLVLLPIMLQTLLGYPPLQAGIAMAPRGIGSFVFMPFVGILTGLVDSRKLLVLRARRSAAARSSGSASSTCRRATGTSSGRSGCRAWRWGCCSCRSRP